MRKIKYIIPIMLLFMTIGFAAISTSLSIDGNMELLGDLDDFNVYFSKALVNGVEDDTIIVSATELDFSAMLESIGTTYTVEYDITNASSAFDADVTISCTGSTDYFSISNVFDSDTPISARSSRTGVLTLVKIKSLATEKQNNTVTCDITASPVEIEQESDEDVPVPVDLFMIGREIAIGEEKFNIISEQEDTITMLAQYNLGTDYRQTTVLNPMKFSEEAGWEYGSPPIDVNIQSYESNAKTYINEYVTYLKSLTNDLSLTGDLISIYQLESLGYKFNDGYTDEALLNAETNTKYSNWLTNGQRWWTKTAHIKSGIVLYVVTGDGSVSSGYHYSTGRSIRPVITISKDTLVNYN